MEKKPKVSIIIPCYNQGKYIEETINSVLQQVYTDYEVIIVNDGSTDKITKDILCKIKNEKIKIFHINNEGVSNARNYAIKKSKGRYILPLDADDKLHPAFLSKTVNYIENNKNVGIVYTKVRYFGVINKISKTRNYSIEKMLAGNLIVNCALFKRSDYDKTEGYDVKFRRGLEDWDFWLSLISLGIKVHRINETLFYYRIKQISRNNVISPIDMKQLKSMIYKKHSELYGNYYLKNYKKSYWLITVLNIFFNKLLK